MINKGFKDKRGYFIFSVIGFLLVLTGVMMSIFNYTASSEIGLKYGPGERSSISGSLVIILGIILLVGVLIFYLSDHKKKRT